MNLNPYIFEFLRYCKVECHYSKATISAYQTDLVQFQSFNSANLSFEMLAETYFDWILNSAFSDRTKSRKMSTIKCFFTYLVNENICASDIYNLIPEYKFSFNLFKIVNQKTIDELINLPDKSTKKGLRDFMILEFLYSTGLRVSECVNLRYSDFDLVQCTVKVAGKGAKQRIVPLTSSLVFLFNEMAIKDTNKFVFSNSNSKPVTRQLIFYIVKKYFSLLKNSTVSMSPHSFRHAFASHLLEGGARLRDVQLLLGHASISSTQNYLKLTDTYRKKMFLQAHPRGDS